jgi:hypothetical protein
MDLTKNIITILVLGVFALSIRSCWRHKSHRSENGGGDSVRTTVELPVRTDPR